MQSNDGDTPRPSDLWKCKCGGRLELTDHDATDASATEYYRCVRCGSSGEVDYFYGPSSPRQNGVVVPNSDEYGHTTPQEGGES
jgi:hypothetical protein